MIDELMEMDSVENLSETEGLAETELLAQQYNERINEALENGDVQTARYYLGELQELYESDEQQRALGTHQGEISFGGSRVEDLESKLKSAERMKNHAEHERDVLLSDKAHGFIGVDPSISNRNFQIKVYTKEIENLKKELQEEKALEKKNSNT